MEVNYFTIILILYLLQNNYMTLLWISEKSKYLKIWSVNASLLDFFDHRKTVMEGALKYHILQTVHFTDEEK